MNAYRPRILGMLRSLVEPYMPLTRALDFGSEDGWYAQMVRQERIANEVMAVDVQRRPAMLVETLLYDGQRLPFEDRCFDLVYSIDVLHHCPDPRGSLKEALRCTCKYFLIKDHTYQRWWGYLTLCALDEVGNRRFGIPSLYRYQRGWEWLSWIEAEGFTVDRMIYPAVCHTGLLGWQTNPLQFMALCRRD